MGHTRRQRFDGPAPDGTPARARNSPRHSPRATAFYVSTLLALIATTSTGCYSTTRIYSQPPGATVVLDGERGLGTTPIELEALPWVWTRRTLSFYKEGRQPQTVRLSGEFRTGNLVACLCTLGLLFPVMLLARYPAQVGAVLPEIEAADDASTLHEDASIHFAHRSDGVALH